MTPPSWRSPAAPSRPSPAEVTRRGGGAVAPRRRLRRVTAAVVATTAGAVAATVAAAVAVVPAAVGAVAVTAVATQRQWRQRRERRRRWGAVVGVPPPLRLFHRAPVAVPRRSWQQPRWPSGRGRRGTPPRAPPTVRAAGRTMAARRPPRKATPLWRRQRPWPPPRAVAPPSRPPLPPPPPSTSAVAATAAAAPAIPPVQRCHKRWTASQDWALLSGLCMYDWGAWVTIRNTQFPRRYHPHQRQHQRRGAEPGC